MRAIAALIAIGALTAALAACGDSRREVAQRYVDAVRAKDWSAACEVSAEGDDCVSLLRGVYADPTTRIPTVAETERVVREIDGRTLVNFEYIRIR